jgi:hypothetical protein
VATAGETPALAADPDTPAKSKKTKASNPNNNFLIYFISCGLKNQA